jgi:hypothetical protein
VPRSRNIYWCRLCIRRGHRLLLLATSKQPVFEHEERGYKDCELKVTSFNDCIFIELSWYDVTGLRSLQVAAFQSKNVLCTVCKPCLICSITEFHTSCQMTHFLSCPNRKKFIIFSECLSITYMVKVSRRTTNDLMINQFSSHWILFSSACFSPHGTIIRQ